MTVRNAVKAAKSCRPLNALITETFDVAQKQSEHHERRGRVPFTLVVKDNFAVENVRMTCASKMLEAYVAPYTATVVQRLIERGGCHVGKANMDEFGMGATSTNSHFGPVRNPCQEDVRIDAEPNDFLIAGGSSGGCAVAVAKGFADVAIGSDTGGSTRNPASFCGVFGFKPSFGLMSRSGLVPLCNSFDTPSIFARSAQECQQYFDWCLGHDPKDLTSRNLPENLQKSKFECLKGVRIGIPKEFHNDYVSQDASALWNDAKRRLKEAGAEVVEQVSLPHSPHSLTCYHIMTATDVQSNMARYLAVFYGHRTSAPTKNFEELVTLSRNEAFAKVVRRRIFAGNFYNLKENRGRYFVQAAKVRRLLQQDFSRAFRSVDALLIPSTSRSAPLISEFRRQSLAERRRDDFFTQSANLCGLPAISVPFGRCSRGLPIGLQLISDYLHDFDCLRLGELLYELKE